MANTDYRKKYEEHYGITWDRRKYEIHHIDGNRDNNEIENLILLPKKLHTNLHKALSRSVLQNDNTPIWDVIQRYMYRELNGISDWPIGVGIGYIIDAIIDCREWSTLKDFGYYKLGGEKIGRLE